MDTQGTRCCVCYRAFKRNCDLVRHLETKEDRVHTQYRESFRRSYPRNQPSLLGEQIEVPVAAPNPQDRLTRASTHRAEEKLQETMFENLSDIQTGPDNLCETEDFPDGADGREDDNTDSELSLTSQALRTHNAALQEWPYSSVQQDENLEYFLDPNSRQRILARGDRPTRCGS